MQEFLFQFCAFYMGLSIGDYIEIKYNLNFLEDMVVSVLSLCLTSSIFGIYYKIDKIDTFEFWGCMILAMIMSKITINQVSEKEGLRK